MKIEKSQSKLNQASRSCMSTCLEPSKHSIWKHLKINWITKSFFSFCVICWHYNHISSWLRNNDRTCWELLLGLYDCLLLLAIKKRNSLLSIYGLRRSTNNNRVWCILKHIQIGCVVLVNNVTLWLGPGLFFALFLFVLLCEISFVRFGGLPVFLSSDVILIRLGGLRPKWLLFFKWRRSGLQGEESIWYAGEDLWSH